MQMEWLAIASLAGTGAYAARQDASQTFLNFFNAMVSGFVQQLDDQWVKRIFKQNESAFPNMTRRPKLIIKGLQKTIELEELGAFGVAFKSIAPLGDYDIKAIRKRSGVLPETLPPEEETEPEPDIPTDENESVDSSEGDAEDEMDEAEMEAPLVDAGAIRTALHAFGDWTKDHAPSIYNLLNREASE